MNIRMCICICVCMYIYIYVCMYVCIFKNYTYMYTTPSLLVPQMTLSQDLRVLENMYDRMDVNKKGSIDLSSVEASFSACSSTVIWG